MNQHRAMKLVALCYAKTSKALFMWKTMGTNEEQNTLSTWTSVFFHHWSHQCWQLQSPILSHAANVCRLLYETTERQAVPQVSWPHHVSWTGQIITFPWSKEHVGIRNLKIQSHFFQSYSQMTVLYGPRTIKNPSKYPSVSLMYSRFTRVIYSDKSPKIQGSSYEESLTFY